MMLVKSTIESRLVRELDSLLRQEKQKARRRQQEGRPITLIANALFAMNREGWPVDALAISVERYNQFGAYVRVRLVLYGRARPSMDSLSAGSEDDCERSVSRAEGSTLWIRVAQSPIDCVARPASDAG